MADAVQAVELASGELLRSASRAIQAEVLDRPRRHGVEVGRDYAGASVMALPEFQRFEEALKGYLPGRFTGEVGQLEFAQQYAFPVIEGFALRLAGDDEHRDEALLACVNELIELLGRSHDRVIAVRVVTDVEVTEPVDLGDVHMSPVGPGGLHDAYRAIEALIPGSILRLDDAVPFGPMTSRFALLVTEAKAPRGSPFAPGHYSAAELATRRLSSALGAIRLATAATADTVVEAIAQPGYVRLRRPIITSYPFTRIPLIQRVVTVRTTDGISIASLAEKIGQWSSDEPQPNPLGVAIERYNRSYLERPWFDQLVDLSIALEAALLSGSPEKEDIGLRLRSRAAALLAEEQDGDSVIYADIKAAYNLRSWVVHASNPRPQDIAAEIDRISVCARSPHRGIKAALAMDRVRDITRRSILARGFLGEAGNWPLGKAARQKDVEGELINPETRESWKAAWRLGITNIGLGAAAGRANDPDTEPRVRVWERESGFDPM